MQLLFITLPTSGFVTLHGHNLQVGGPTTNFTPLRLIILTTYSTLLITVPLCRNFPVEQNEHH